MEMVNSDNDDIIKFGIPFSFSDVKRETAGETYKYWNQLLKTNSFGKIEKFQEILSQTVPLPALEEKLRLILIDTLHLKNEVINVLLSQNDYSIKRVLRCKWFFRNLSAEFCTKEIFPRVSISLRFKIINRLSKYLENEEEAEKFFAFMKTNFDSEGVEILLPRCSPGFILNYCKTIRPLLEYPTTKRKRVLRNICTRYPDTGLQVLDLLFDHKTVTNFYELRGCKGLLQYFAGNHTDLFIPFFKKYAPQIKFRIFSGKLSWKFGLKLKDYLLASKEIIKNGIFYEKYLFPKLELNDQIKYLSAIVLPDAESLTFQNWINASFRITPLIKRIRPSDRYSIISSVFKEVYNLEYKDHTKCWSPDLLALLSPSERHYFVEVLEKFFNSTETEFKENLNTIFFVQRQPECLIYLYEFSVAFDKLKNILIKTPDKYKRQTVMSFMVKCCAINRDAKGLEEVVDLIATRHRNDDPQIIYEFAGYICNEFPAVEVTPSIFQKVLNLLLFCSAKGYFDSYTFGRLTERAIYQRLESNEEADELIKNFFKFAVLKSHSYVPFLSDYKNKHSRTLLLAVGEKIKLWIQTHQTENKHRGLHSLLISTCEKFNKYNKKNKVVLRDFPGFAETLKELYKSEYSNLGAGDWPLDELETCDVHLLNSNWISPFLCHLLKKNPEVIIKHLEAVSDYFDKRLYPFLVKQLTYLGMRDNLKDITLTSFQKGDSYGKRINGLRVYSLVCTIEEFTAAVEEFIPHEDHVKEGADDEFTRLQLMIPSIIKNIRPRWKNLNLILKFFRGDFLKPVMFSFYASCYHSRVDFIVPFLKEHLFTVPQRISYTKDIIRLICEFSNRGEKINFCLRCWQDNKHYSIRRIILQFLSKSFMENPTRELFNCLTKCILESEEIIIDVRPDLSKIPKEFVNDYAMTLWKFPASPSFKENFQRQILGFFNLENINLLSVEFCEEIIRDNLFNPKSTLSVEQFAAFYCIANPDATSSRMEMILNLIGNSQMNARTVASFMRNVRSASLSKPDRFVNMFSLLLKNWPSSHDLYEEKLLFIYHELYYRILQTSKEPSFASVEFGKQLRELYSGMNDVKDLTIILLETLKEFVNKIVEAKLPFDPLLVARELIIQPRERTFAMVAIGALPPKIVDLYREDDTFNANGDKAKLNELVNIFENMNDDIMWIYFTRTFGHKKVVIK